ncbi:MAG: hypothetical protein WCX59_03605 [Anaerovoracaceae bacterium]
MKTLKDLIYNKNDLVIVLVVLVLAALLIWNRIDAIIAYPSTMIAEAEKQSQLEEEPEVIPMNPDQEEAPPEDVVMYAVYINPGESLEVIGEKFVSVSLFRSAEDFIQLANDMGVTTQIKAGNFIMPSNSTPEEVMQIITQPGL